MDDLSDFIPEIGYFIYRKCFPGWEIIKSVIDFHDLSYVVAGKGMYYINDRELPVAAGDVLYITPGNLREAKSSLDEPMELFAINFRLIANMAVTNASVLPFQTKNKLGHDPRILYLFKQLTRVWIEKNDLYTSEARAITIQILCELIRRVYRQRPAAAFDARIEAVKDYIHEHFDLPLTLKTLAETVGLNDVYLGALFKKTEGSSISAYINKIRISHATDILIAEKATISEVAYRCGFSDAFYFCRVFKRYKGYPPSEIGKHYFLA